MDTFKFQTPLRFGLLAGLLTLILGFVSYIFYEAIFSSFWITSFIGIVFFMIVIFIAVWATVTYRKENGNMITFGHAFAVSMIVFALNTFIGAIEQWTIPNVVDKEYPEKASALLRDKVSEEMEKMGASDESIEDAMKGMTAEKFNPPFADFSKGLLKSLAIGAVLSLIIAIFTKRHSVDMLRTENHAR